MKYKDFYKELLVEDLNLETNVDNLIKFGGISSPKKPSPSKPKEITDFEKLGGDEWVELRKIKTPDASHTYSHEIRCNGKIVSVLPYRRAGRDSWEIGIREEITHCWSDEPSLSSLTGGVDEGEDPKESAKRELFEEAGYNVDISQLKDLGTCRGTKSTDTVYYLYGIDLTDSEEPSKPKGDGTEKDLKPLKWMHLNDSIVDPLVYVCYKRLGL